MLIGHFYNLMKCSQCKLVNFRDALACVRCEAELSGSIRADTAEMSFGKRLLCRGFIVGGVCLAIIFGFYISLIASADRLNAQQKEVVARSIKILEQKQFRSEALLLSRLTAYRSTDHWLNAAVAKENAYAATNFPFAIMTLYTDFFTYPVDDVEKAAILLHEARHLRGEGEKEAYEYVWKNRAKLGWTEDRYGSSDVWRNIRYQTREHVPELFVCPENEFNDCTR